MIYALTSPSFDVSAWLWYGFFTATLGVIALSYRRASQQQFITVWRGYMYFLIAWVAAVAVTNRFAFNLDLALPLTVAVAVAGFSIELTRLRPLVVYLAFVSLATGVPVFLLPLSTTHRILLFGSLITLIAVMYIISRWRINAREALTHREQELRRITSRLQKVEAEERRYVARELHDEIGALLTSLKRLLVGDRLQKEKAERLLDQLIERVRHLTLNLRSEVLDDLGLTLALLEYAERYIRQAEIEVDVRSELTPIQRFRSEVETAVYRLVQEALTNVARHAHTDKVHVLLYAETDRLVVHVVDYGVGFDLNNVLSEKQSLGLRGMRERAEILGGSFSIDTTPGVGTRITAILPIHDE